MEQNKKSCSDANFMCFLQVVQFFVYLNYLEFVSLDVELAYNLNDLFGDIFCAGYFQSLNNFLMMLPNDTGI